MQQGLEEPLGRAYRNDVVFLSVNHKNRNMHITDREIRTELIQHQPTHRENPVMPGGDVQRRQIRGLENKGGRFMRRCAVDKRSGIAVKI